MTPLELFPNMPTQPSSNRACFLFLEMPREIRLIIYERLPSEVDYYSFHGIGPWVRFNKTRYIFETTRASTAILRTCRRVYAEAEKTIKKNIAITLSEPARIIIKEWSKSDRREFGDLCLVIHYRWQFLTHSTPPMAWGPVGWNEILIQGEVESIVGGEYKNTDYAKAIVRLARGWPALEVVPDIAYEWRSGHRYTCSIDMIRSTETSRQDMGLQLTICVLPGKLTA
jgi:hypothetical protein